MGEGFLPGEKPEETELESICFEQARAAADAVLTSQSSVASKGEKGGGKTPF